MMDFKKYTVESNSRTKKSGAGVTIALFLIVFIVSVGGIIAFKSSSTSNAQIEPILIGLAKQNDLYKTTLLTSFDADKDFKFVKNHDLSDMPETVAKSSFLVNINTGDILYASNEMEVLPIASLAKIMTAIIASEHRNMNDTIIVSKKASSIGENTMNISAGESYTLEELLYGLFLHSGNDAAYAIAEGVAVDKETFVLWMNIKAKELGLENTLFTDPSGLDDKAHSTAHDLAKLTSYALKHKDLRKIAGTVEYEITGNADHKYIPLYNQTNLLTTYPGVKGFKTGYTEEAGLCLVTYAQNDNVELVGIVLNSIDRKGDMVNMLDYGFAKYSIFLDHPYKTQNY